MSAGIKQPMAHTFSGGLAAPDWPALTLSEVDMLLSRYPQAPSAQRILTFSPRPFSAASVVSTPRGEVFVKRHHRGIRDIAGLEEEHALLAYLSEKGVAVPSVLADRHGATACTIGDWTYEVHALAPGVDLYGQAASWTPFQSAAHAYSAGQALARLHSALEQYDAPARKASTLVTGFTLFSSSDPLAALEKFLEARPALAAYLAVRDWRRATTDVLLPFYERLRPLLPSLPSLWTHNDLHGSNMLWSSPGGDAHVSAIIDFGLADRTTAVHDLATAIERNAIAWLALEQPYKRVVQADHAVSLLDGYLAHRSLSPEELAAIPALLPVVHAEFALVEADYFLAILKDAAKADLAYDGYYLGHASWFSGTAGQRLLRTLERRLASASSPRGGSIRAGVIASAPEAKSREGLLVTPERYVSA